ncbi:MAG: hypothetical protein IJC99_07155 [Clostridia bacterium]|nr:hypothetical protein [Clostridia bacterium]
MTDKPALPLDPRLLLRDAGAAAVAVIVSLMNDTENKPELRLKAAESILDRACGKSGGSLFDGGEGSGVIRFEGELESWSR